VDIGILLQKTSALFQKVEREHTRETGFTSSQSHFLIYLLQSQSLTMLGAAEAMKLDKSSATRMVKILERDGLILRGQDHKDKRVVHIELTPTGEEVAREIQKKREAYYSRIIENLPPGHVREVMNSSEILFTALEEALQT